MVQNMKETNMLHRWVLSVIGVLAATLAGCQSYTVPGGAADFSRLGLTPEAKAQATDRSVQKILDKKPLVTFPANIAVARVQAGDYESYSYHCRYPSRMVGAYSVITARDVEKDEDFQVLAALPQVAGVGPLKRILLDQTLNSDEQLRAGRPPARQRAALLHLRHRL